MQLHVGSKHLAAEVAVALDVSGREFLVIVAKATWSIPEPGARPRPLPPQPLAASDQYYGEPGVSAMRYGADMARFKARCDVLFDACAHSPSGQPVHELLVGVEVGDARHGGVHKSVRVLGARHWQGAGSRGKFKPSQPEPFTRMPLHHGFAFGGTRWYEQGGQKEGGQRLCEAQLANPAGMGFAGPNTLAQMLGEPVPHLEHPGEPVQAPDKAHAPHALSAVGRHWLPRRNWAGTYDQAWQRDVFPLLPLDFDEQFHQCAPLDQQMPYPQGGEQVRLVNLLPGRPDVRFTLPPMPLQVRVLRSDYSTASPQAVVDTLFFQTEERCFSAVWRASVPIKRRIQEIRTIAVGPVDPAWWAQQVAGVGSGSCMGCSGNFDDMATANAENDAVQAVEGTP
jgi:hypothetical protein